MLIQNIKSTSFGYDGPTILKRDQVVLSPVPYVVGASEQPEEDTFEKQEQPDAQEKDEAAIIASTKPQSGIDALIEQERAAKEEADKRAQSVLEEIRASSGQSIADKAIGTNKD